MHGHPPACCVQIQRLLIILTVWQGKQRCCAVLSIWVTSLMLPLHLCCTDSCVNKSCGVQDKDYTAAAQLAFELKQPGRLLAVVNKACEAGPAKAHHILTKLVGDLSEEELKLCLEYIRDWNSNSRHCSVAQAMLQAILVKHRPQVKGYAVQLDSLQHLMQPICPTYCLWCF